MRKGTCVHFNGIMERRCKAGVDYLVKFGNEIGLAFRMPCCKFGEYRKPEMVVSCDRFLEPVPEEIEQDRLYIEAVMEKTRAAIRVASAWRVKPKPAEDRREVVECPVCKGKLHLSQSSYNGHVHGACETEGCVRWME